VVESEGLSAKRFETETILDQVKTENRSFQRERFFYYFTKTFVDEKEQIPLKFPLYKGDEPEARSFIYS